MDHGSEQRVTCREKRKGREIDFSDAGVLCLYFGVARLMAKDICDRLFCCGCWI